VQLKAIAPAKIILTGEHSVVYGKPAIISAVNRFATTHISASLSQNIRFTLSDFKQKAHATLKTLRILQKRLLESYRLCIQGELSIRQVLQKPVELFQFALVSFLDACNLELNRGLKLDVSSNIPIGCGMGSSAATIVSTIAAISRFLKIELKTEWLHRLSIEVERLQHGFSSGLDSYVSLHGGCVKFQNNQAIPIQLPPSSFYLVNTGAPIATTGECVMHVAKHHDSAIWDAFEQVAIQIEKAIIDSDKERFKENISYNQLLLEKLGVVPEKIAAFIKRLERQNIAAKICGAGATHGESAGVILLVGDTLPTALCEEFGYKIIEVQGETEGVRFC